MVILLKRCLRHILYCLFIFVATFSLLHMWLVQYLFFVVYYILLYVFSERNNGRMTPVLRLTETGLSFYLFGMNVMTFLGGVYFMPHVFYLMLLCVGLWLYLMARRKVPVPRFFFLSIFFPFLCFAFLPDPWIQKQLLADCPRVMGVKRVKPLLTFCNAHWSDALKPFLTRKNLQRLVENADSPRAVVTGKNPDMVYVSLGRPTYRKPQEPFFATVKINRRSGKIESATASSSLMHLAYDKKHDAVFGTALDEDKVYVMDAQTLRLKDKFRTALHPIDVAVDETARTILVLSDYGVYVYDWDTYKEEKFFTPRLAPNMFVVSSKFHKAYVCGYATTFILRAVDVVDGSERWARAGWIPPFSMLCSGADLDENEGILFVSVPLERRIYAYDAERLRRRYRFNVPRGIRDIAYDAQRKVLYAGNYITGNLEVIDPFKKKVKRQIFVGKRIRDIFYSPVTRRVYVASSLGFFEVSP